MRNVSRGVLAVTVLVLGSLACTALTSSALLEDDFSGDGNWGTGTDADSSVEYENAALRFLVSRDFWYVWSTPDEEVYENVHVEVTVYNNSSDSTAAFGLVCNLQTLDTSYYFAVTGAGEYAIGRYSLTDDGNCSGINTI